MSELFLMMSIIERARLPQFVSVYQERNAEISLITLGRGTAPGEMLNYLGLDKSEKAVMLTVVTGELFREIRHELEHRIRIDIPGTGIVFTVPLSSIGGTRELQFLTDGQAYEKGEETIMKGTAHELLIAVSNQGYNELVMEAARSAGAEGGTVIHAQGTGMHKAEKFLGISLASEKDILFIVTKTEKKNVIMQAIMKEAGLATKAGTIVFSLPVTETAGLRILEDDDRKPETACGETSAE